MPHSAGHQSCFAQASGSETGFQLVAQAIEPGDKLSDAVAMKTRCFDHIDLRVKDMEVAKKFYGKFLSQLGFVRERHEPSPREEKAISQTAHASRSGRIHAKKSTGSRKLYAMRAAKIWKALKSASITVPGITRSFSKIQRATNWKFAAGKVRSLRNEQRSTNSWDQ